MHSLFNKKPLLKHLQTLYNHLTWLSVYLKLCSIYLMNLMLKNYDFLSAMNAQWLYLLIELFVGSKEEEEEDE